MKICVIGLRGIPNVSGGIETHCEQLYSRMARLRPEDEFTIIGRIPYIGREPYMMPDGVRVLPLPAMRSGYLETISNTVLGVLAARFQLGSQLVHIHAIGPALAVPLAKLLGMKVLLTHHGEDFNRDKWNALAKGVLRLGEWLGVRLSDEIIAVSPSLAERLRSRFPAKKDRITYIPNGADHFDNIIADTDAATLERFGLIAGQYIISVGRLVPEKGFHELIAAHQRAPMAQKLVIVGGSAGDSYERKIKSMAGANVVFTDTVPKSSVAALVRNASLFVLASHHEGLPIAALEAAAAGTPILLSDITPHRDLGLDAQHYFRVGNIANLAAMLCTDVSTLRSNTLIDGFTWEAVSRETSKIYDGFALPQDQAALA